MSSKSCHCAGSPNASVDPDFELARLLSETLLGSSTAFSHLVKKVRPRLLAVIHRVVRDRDEASEVLQEVYLKIWTCSSQYDSDRGLAIQWLLGIARNCAISATRSRVRRPRFATIQDHEAPYSEFESPTPTPLEIVAKEDESREVRRCLDALRAEHREILILAFWGDLSHEEISARTCRPLGTVKSWMRRSMLTMRSELAA